MEKFCGKSDNVISNNSESKSNNAFLITKCLNTRGDERNRRTKTTLSRFEETNDNNKNDI